jgi:hypothetical protein
MLRLLAQREQGYEDIAALMGLSVDEVRARVADALAALEREGEQPPPLPPEPEPPVEPEPPAAAPEPPAPPPAARPAPMAAAAPTPSGGNRPRPQLGFPKQPGARAAIVAGALALVGIVVVLVVSGGGGGGGGESSAGVATGAAGGTGQEAAANGEATEPTEAVLKPVGGSGASGTATFGNFEESLALLVEAKGLEQTGKGEIYAVWLAQSPTEMIPVGETEVEANGEINAQVGLEIALLAFIANETISQVVITRADQGRLETALTKAAKTEESPAYTGTTVLRGKITGPIVGAELPESSE